MPYLTFNGQIVSLSIKALTYHPSHFRSNGLMGSSIALTLTYGSWGYTLPVTLNLKITFFFLETFLINFPYSISFILSFFFLIKQLNNNNNNFHWIYRDFFFFLISQRFSKKMFPSILFFILSFMLKCFIRSLFTLHNDSKSVENGETPKGRQQV